MSIAILKYEYHPVQDGVVKPYKFHYINEILYFSIKIQEEYFEISEPRFPGDERERIYSTKLVKKYFKILSKKVEDDLKVALSSLEPVELIYQKNEDPNAFVLIDIRILGFDE